MKAPEKIYLQVCGDCTINDKETCEQCYKDNPIGNGSEVTWCVDKIFDNDVEYICTDAFIEKACEFLFQYNKNQVLKHGVKATLSCVEYTINVDEFRKYMEGE